MLSKFDGPGRPAAREMLTLFGPLTCFFEPARADAHEMCTIATMSTVRAHKAIYGLD